MSGVATSNGGRTGLVERLYMQYLGREPSASELKSTLAQYAGRAVLERPIAYSLLNTNEFRLHQRGAWLRPIVSQSH